MKNELPEQVLRLVDLAIDEDLGTGDITSEATLEDGAMGRAVIEARQALVCCGHDVADMVFQKLKPGTIYRPLVPEGGEAAAGDILAELEGSMKALMAGERTALNFLQRTCGVATLSRRLSRMAPGRTVILDSRKTVPGWRWLDKMAVRIGGCSNHRMGLYDGILIKDNHIAACGSITRAVRKARIQAPAGLDIEVEVEDLEGLEEAITSGADIVLLDNFSPEQVARAAEIGAGRVRLEVSGGIGTDNVGEYLSIPGLDFISMGALTHSAPAADISMEIVNA